LFESVWLFVSAGHVLDLEAGTTLAALAHHVCDVWPKPDSSIWEVDGDEQFTVSKMGCWAALDRAIRLAEAGQIPDRHIGRWQDERGAIHAWVNDHCWSERLSSYTDVAGGEDIDAAVLLAVRTGFVDADDPRILSTIDVVRRELEEDGLVYRNTRLRGKEGAFVACSFWLADALTRCGQRDAAAEVIEKVIDRANDVGLFSEEIDPSTGDFLGNFPQGLSHLALVTSATTFHEHTRT
jgi:GH15 family glucan-1,4-alpha-glucosidase